MRLNILNSFFGLKYDNAVLSLDYSFLSTCYERRAINRKRQTYHSVMKNSYKRLLQEYYCKHDNSLGGKTVMVFSQPLHS